MVGSIFGSSTKRARTAGSGNQVDSERNGVADMCLETDNELYENVKIVVLAEKFVPVESTIFSHHLVTFIFRAGENPVLRFCELARGKKKTNAFRYGSVTNWAALQEQHPARILVADPRLMPASFFENKFMERVATGAPFTLGGRCSPSMLKQACDNHPANGQSYNVNSNNCQQWVGNLPLRGKALMDQVNMSGIRMWAEPSSFSRGCLQLLHGWLCDRGVSTNPAEPRLQGQMQLVRYMHVDYVMAAIEETQSVVSRKYYVYQCKGANEGCKGVVSTHDVTRLPLLTGFAGFASDHDCESVLVQESTFGPNSVRSEGKKQMTVLAGRGRSVGNWGKFALKEYLAVKSAGMTVKGSVDLVWNQLL
eukprot:TRINITY_DN111272_c0_g1_i1.p1 TRINITY_DN111272_c0_g1~~TRINITY_DN111272_c0_g1_i1.p1  ORF type:complete len:384 (-),score=36.86 TRINITY_DN111272_c0_g1_i1:375-1469(-)